MSVKKTVVCSGSDCNNGKGKILLALSGNRIYLKCGNKGCGLWTRLTIRLPGVNIDFSNAAIVQEVLPKDYHLTMSPATTVVGQ